MHRERLDHGVERAALDERLEHALVQTLGVDARGEVEQIAEAAARAARVEHGLERRLADAAHRAEPETDLRTVGIAELAAGSAGALAVRVRVHDREIGLA